MTLYFCSQKCIYPHSRCILILILYDIFSYESVVHKVFGWEILHRTDWPKHSGAITSQQHESPSPVLWSVSFMH